MCTPKMPKVSETDSEPIATPTMADASVTKARNAAGDKTAKNNQKDIKTSSRGDETEANTKKKKLLGE